MTGTGSVDRLQSGIPGLDLLLEGGLLKGGVYIVQGTPGCGKTLMGNQVSFHHARHGGRVAYVTLLAESHDRMLAHLRRMRFFDAPLVGTQIAYLSGFKVLEEEGLESLQRLLRRAITERGVSLLVLDGLLSAEEAAPSDRELKKFIHELQILTTMTGCTALLLSSTQRARDYHPEHTMVDGILELTDELAQLRSLRHIQILKLRGASQLRGKHTLEITDDGVVVRPRFESRLLEGKIDGAPVLSGHRAFGIERLDQMLRGGVPAQSLTMLLGTSGAGKTTMGLHFLSEGARQGESGLYFGFFESPSALRARSQRLGLALEGAVRDGMVELLWRRPVEGVIDILGEQLMEAVRRRGVKRLCLDGLQGLELAMDFPERTREVFTALGEDLERAGVTTVYTVETRELLGDEIAVPVSGISALTQNVIILRQVERDARIRRLLSILKVRDSDYEPTVEEFAITDRGIVVGAPRPARSSKRASPKRGPHR